MHSFVPFEPRIERSFEQFRIDNAVMNHPVRERIPICLYKSEYTGYVLHMPFQRLGYGLIATTGKIE